MKLIYITFQNGCSFTIAISEVRIKTVNHKTVHDTIFIKLSDWNVIFNSILFLFSFLSFTSRSLSKLDHTKDIFHFSIAILCTYIYFTYPGKGKLQIIQNQQNLYTFILIYMPTFLVYSGTFYILFRKKMCWFYQKDEKNIYIVLLLLAFIFIVKAFNYLLISFSYICSEQEEQKPIWFRFIPFSSALSSIVVVYKTIFL